MDFIEIVALLLAVIVGPVIAGWAVFLIVAGFIIAFGVVVIVTLIVVVRQKDSSISSIEIMVTLIIAAILTYFG